MAHQHNFVHHSDIPGVPDFKDWREKHDADFLESQTHHFEGDRVAIADHAGETRERYQESSASIVSPGPETAPHQDPKDLVANSNHDGSYSGNIVRDIASSKGVKHYEDSYSNYNYDTMPNVHKQRDAPTEQRKSSNKDYMNQEITARTSVIPIRAANTPAGSDELRDAWNNTLQVSLRLFLGFAVFGAVVGLLMCAFWYQRRANTKKLKRNESSSFTDTFQGSPELNHSDPVSLKSSLGRGCTNDPRKKLFKRTVSEAERGGDVDNSFSKWKQRNLSSHSAEEEAAVASMSHKICTLTPGNGKH